MKLRQQPDRNIHQLHAAEDLRLARRVQNPDRFNSAQQTIVYEKRRTAAARVHKLIVIDTVLELNEK